MQRYCEPLDSDTNDQLVLEHNADRIHAFIQNDSDTAWYIILGDGPATVNTGIYLAPSGGWYEINLTNPWDGPIHGICSIASKRLLITEVSRG